MDDFYDKQTYDYYISAGDAYNIGLQLLDPDGAAEAVAGHGMTFKVFDPVANDYISALEKSHDDAVGDGIYFQGDTYAWSELNLDATNKLVVHLKSADTETLGKGIYPFIIVIDKDINSINEKLTILRGNIVVMEHTKSGSDFRDVVVDLGQFQV